MPGTETESHYHDLEKMTPRQILENINKEDHTVPTAVAAAIPAIERLVIAAAGKLKSGGRLFYIGAGTSGRLGIVDASECPPTFGVDPDKVIGLIAGGDEAIRTSVERAEDDTSQGWKDLQKFGITSKDVAIGIAASGRTPYVLAALKKCAEEKIETGCLVCNANSPIAAQADYPIEIIVGPEFLTGSTRMKAGTAQKLVLNMISTCIMIQLGLVEGNKMVNMQLSNDKLVARGIEMMTSRTALGPAEAKALLLKHGSVKKALEALKKPVAH